MSAGIVQCQNCDAPLAAAQRFCGSCGQKCGSGRLTMRQVTQDFLHALTHVDHSIFSLVKQLAYRPGHVAREYIEGKRKKYFGPLAFLLIAVGLASFMIVVAGVDWFAPVTDTGPAGFLKRHINLVILVQMPVLAGWCALFFWSERLHYAEHLVLAAYASGFRILVLALVATPIMYFGHLDAGNRIVVPAYYALWLVYFSVAAVQFYRGETIWTVVRAAVAAILGQLLTMGMILLFIVGYIRFVGP